MSIRNINNFSRTSRIHFCFKNTPKNAVQTYGNRKFPLLLGARGPILSPPYSPPQTASRSNQPFFHSSPTGQTDRLTNGISDKPVRTPAYALLYYSDAAKNAENSQVNISMCKVAHGWKRNYRSDLDKIFRVVGVPDVTAQFLVTVC